MYYFNLDVFPGRYDTAREHSRLDRALSDEVEGLESTVAWFQTEYRKQWRRMLYVANETFADNDWNSWRRQSLNSHQLANLLARLFKYRLPTVQDHRIIKVEYI